MLPFEVSGVVLPPEKGVIEFLYPGGFKADIFHYDGILKEGQTFNRNGELSVIGMETPGGKNSSGINNSSSADKNPLTTEQKTISEVAPEKGTEQNNETNADTNAGAINLTKSANNSKTYFIIAILAVIIFGAGAIFFIRRRKGTP